MPEVSHLRVLISDGTRMSCQLLGSALARHGINVVGSTSNSREFLAAASRQEIDVAVIGLTVDGEIYKGFDLLKALHALRPATNVLMLLDSPQREVVVEAFRAGARGVFCKEDSLDGLWKCLECIHEGQIWANREQLGFALDALASTPSIRTVATRSLEVLSKRERDVVQCLAEGLTNREIAKRLRLSHHTIKNYLFRIFDKVGVSSRVELLFLSLSHPVPTHVAPQEAVPNTFVACRQSAEAGSPLAQLRLANMYRDGIGTTPDPVEAYMWALICEKSIEATDLQVRKAKNAISLGLLHHEVLEAERRADDWCRAAGKAAVRPFKVAASPAKPNLPKASSA
jgi:two-component system nitrate/nitrite response regulator NarL